MRSKLTAVVIAAALVPAVLLAACGDDDDSADGTTTTAQEHGCAVMSEGEVTIVAKDLAWDVDCLQAPEGIAFTVVVDNQDDGVNHDFHLALDDEVLHTPLEAGPVVQRLEVPALDAGEHTYICEIHPNMAGTLEVLEPLEELPGD